MPHGAVAPVLKSNAYGHGLFEVAGMLEKSKEKFPFFVVDSYFEALALRSHGFKTPLLIIGYTRPETILASNLKHTSFAITSIESLEALQSATAPVSIHIKFDTGMRRQGLLAEETDKALSILSANPYIILEGICTHFADADNTDVTFTKNQITLWNGLVRRMKSAAPSLRYMHASNTDGSGYAENIDANVMRLGIGLYGLSQNAKLNNELDLKPVLELKTILTGVKTLKAGESAGYGATFTAQKNITIATIPVGYFEAIDRRLSSGPQGAARGFIQVGPNRIACPIIGRVSMNITTVDISALPKADARIGTEAIVVSRESADPNSLRAMAESTGSITYEHAVHIPAHLKRIVTE